MNNQKKIIAMIPARMGSTRFPGKPIIDICGLTMIEHVWQRVKMCSRITAQYLVTCDEDIRTIAEGFGANVIMTSDKHQRCTDRVAEGCQKLLKQGKDFDVVLNIQGDEPLLDPITLDLLIEPFLSDEKITVVNLIELLETEQEINNYNNVKTVFDQQDFVLYFSRLPVPDNRKVKPKYYKQLGVYGLTKQAIFKFAEMSETPLEIAESDDMMRFVENGIPVKAVLSDCKTSGVDTPSDHKRICRLMENDKIFQKYRGGRKK